MITPKETRDVIAAVVEKIANEYQPEKIILFGSYASGDPDEDSDIDLFIIKRTSRSRRERYIEVDTLIYDRNREVWFSPLVYTPEEVDYRLSIGDDFVEEVLSKGQVLYAR
jgi:predicted nucleotidyltransferase